MPKKHFFSLNELIEEAKRFDSRSSFAKEAAAHYKFARKMDLLDEVCAHLPDRRQKWDLAKLKEAAAPYPTRAEFKKANPAAYIAALRLKCLDELF